jgi:hypothetical protein
MTTATEPGSVIEYEFQCFCGAPIVTTEKTVSCAGCGKILGIRRVGRRQHWKIAPPPRPYRNLRVEDLGLLIDHSVYYLLLGGCLLWMYYLALYLLGIAE